MWSAKLRLSLFCNVAWAYHFHPQDSGVVLVSFSQIQKVLKEPYPNRTEILSRCDAVWIKLDQSRELFTVPVPVPSQPLASKSWIEMAGVQWVWSDLNRNHLPKTFHTAFATRNPHFLCHFRCLPPAYGPANGWYLCANHHKPHRKKVQNESTTLRPMF